MSIFPSVDKMFANNIKELQKDNCKMLDNIEDKALKIKVARIVFDSFFYSLVIDEIITRDLGFVRLANIFFFYRCTIGKHCDCRYLSTLVLTEMKGG